MTAPVCRDLLTAAGAGSRAFEKVLFADKAYEAAG